jgi:hypothetical protein
MTNIRYPSVRTYRRVLTALIVLTTALLAGSASQTSAQGQPACPCTIWPSSAVPTVASVSDTRSTEVGVKFRSDVNGFVAAIRFYKGAANTGTHTANLWTASGTSLARVTVSG